MAKLLKLYTYGLLFPHHRARILSGVYLGVRTPGGVLPSDRLMGMCRWMGSRFHDWIDYNGVAFSVGANRVTWGRTFAGFQG